MTATPRKEFYGQDIQIKERNGDKTIYSLDGDDGREEMTAFMPLPGVELIYNDFHTATCFQMIGPLSDIMEINHCRRGRFECEFKRGSYAYLGEGDLAINMLENQTNGARFP